MTVITNSQQETEELGEKLARCLAPGTVLAFYGDLGAGKTTFTRGLARGLGVTARVTSPTYTIVNEYQGDVPLFHFDMYRLNCADELFEIGWEDYLLRGGIAAVEWSENVEGAFTSDTVYVKIEKDGENSRVITITGIEEGQINANSGN